MRPAAAVPQVQVTVSLPLALILEVGAYAARRDLSRSGAMARLLGEALSEGDGDA